MQCMRLKIIKANMIKYLVPPPTLKSHSLCVSKGEIPKGKQYAKINRYVQD